MNEQKYIKIRGAREHNLKNINLDIPRDKFVVMTGLSGSGKSTLAFDTIFAEGQRRYVESLSTYARQFLGQMDKPDIDRIEGLSPAISIDQKTGSRNPRSTVGTVTEVYDYLRLLYARAGTMYCPSCGRKIVKQSIDEILDRIMSYPKGAKLYIIAPIISGKKGQFKQLFSKLLRKGIMRVRVDGKFMNLDSDIELEKNKKHNIDVVVDRLRSREGIRSRLSSSLETAFELSSGPVFVRYEDEEREKDGEELFSREYACPECNISLPDIEPQSFSFNNPAGACPECLGLGEHKHFDVNLLIPEPQLTINEGAVHVGGWNFDDPSSWGRSFIEALSSYYGFSLDIPFSELPEDIKNIILYGNGKVRIPVDTSNSKYDRGAGYKSSWSGLIPSMERRYRESSGEEMRSYYEQYMTVTPCSACGGARLKKEILSVRFGEKNIYELTQLPISKTMNYLLEASKSSGEEEKTVSAQIIRELEFRLKFLNDVGLGYLTLDRASAGLSGGESQRIRLATQIGSGLMGVLYILDEPSIGLHQRDNEKLLKTLKSLRDIGNTVLVVEHDEDTMREADWIIDLGPGAGINGGRVVAQGKAEDIMNVKNSVTADYLSGRKHIPVPRERRKGNGHFLEVKGAAENNLKNINVKIPLGCLTCVTGVSGSGKSSLVSEIILPKLESELNNARRRQGKYKEIKGWDNLDKVIAIDQSPIGRTPRSNPATYTGTFDLIRALFAKTSAARARGYKPGRFSFNVKGGRCEACKGDGVKKIEMLFMSDLYVPCEICHGKRYNTETLEVTYRGKNISEVLNMSIGEALEFFEAQPGIVKKIQCLNDVGLSYLSLGQPSTQLSGGEAQRIKLASELSRTQTGRTFYILDEPTTGLHTADVHLLCRILHYLVDQGNTVVVIEHNLDLIKTADFIIDLGPEGGDGGGELVASGTPEKIAENPGSYTGQFLKRILKAENSNKI